ncbi:ArsR/SmtB family transcription factor [Sphingobacterium sp. HJSM2_6]|uniref:ArsR/SmtB family transcription factor n=1 Tax=Sphingobacterium sp. HJSM2_6 TaxID=3366264 RepID=UPI003BDA202D
MGITKTDLHSIEQNKLSLMFKALGHPARIAIIQHIINQQSCICTDLVVELGLAQATISQHLKELKHIGIIQGSIEGKSVCYCIDEVVWKEFQQLFQQFFNQDIQTNSCC